MYWTISHYLMHQKSGFDEHHKWSMLTRVHLFLVVCAQAMRSYFKRVDPFFDEQENHSLIGVANVFLSCLLYDVKLQYTVPIINQKGEVCANRLDITIRKSARHWLIAIGFVCFQVAGRLHVEVERLSGELEEISPDGETQEHKLTCMVR